MSVPILHRHPKCGKTATSAEPLALMRACERLGVVLRCESCNRALYGFMMDFGGKWVAIT